MTTTPPILELSSLPIKPSALWPLRFAVLALASLTFLIACGFPAVYYIKPSGDPVDPSIGLAAFFSGPLAILYGCFAWYANVLLLLLAWIFILCRLWLTAAILTALGILIAFDSYSLIGKAVDADEGGSNKLNITAIGPAFHIWLAAFVLTFLGCILLKTLAKKPRQIVSPV